MSVAVSSSCSISGWELQGRAEARRRRRRCGGAVCVNMRVIVTVPSEARHHAHLLAGRPGHRAWTCSLPSFPSQCCPGARRCLEWRHWSSGPNDSSRHMRHADWVRLLNDWLQSLLLPSLLLLLLLLLGRHAHITLHWRCAAWRQCWQWTRRRV